ncbi:hypothetical protein C6P42_004707 [Pichia californica]|nr:hypothetical protein C6P42_004707 [[Candida] californica]
MGKYYCAYCQSCLTHGSRSIRKNHLHGKHHQRLYFEYYDKIRNEYPEVNEEINGDPSLNNLLFKEMYNDIPGSNNEFFKDNNFYNLNLYGNNDNKSKFQLPVPETSISLPNPPPNALYMNYSNVIYKNRINQPYKSNNNNSFKKTFKSDVNGSITGTNNVNGYGFPSTSYGYKGRNPRNKLNITRENNLTNNKVSNSNLNSNSNSNTNSNVISTKSNIDSNKTVSESNITLNNEIMKNSNKDLSTKVNDSQNSAVEYGYGYGNNYRNGNSYGYGYGYGYGYEKEQRGEYNQGEYSNNGYNNVRNNYNGGISRGSGGRGRGRGFSRGRGRGGSGSGYRERENRGGYYSGNEGGGYQHQRYQQM